MALHDPLWMQNSAGYTAIDDRRLVTAIRTPGVLGVTDLKVTQRAAGANRSVDVAAGGCVVEGTHTAGQGHYLCTSDAVENVPLTAAPSAGQSRIDLIVASVADAAAVGSGPNEWTIDVVTGTPGATPAAPAVPASSLLLAEVLVPGLATTILDAQITDKRVLSGDPATGLAAAPTVGPSFDGQLVSAAGQVYAAAGGLWWPVRPTVNTSRMASNRPSNGSTNSTVSFATWGSASISGVSWSSVMVAELTGHFSGGGGSVVVDISYDGGSTWLSSPERNFTSSGGLDFVPVSLSVATTGTPTGNIVARGRFKSAAGATIAATNGYLLLTAQPGL